VKLQKIKIFLGEAGYMNMEEKPKLNKMDEYFRYEDLDL